ncbi:VanZ family protein [Agrococcus sp. BE272]|uniref:VanZ family protein n=1 Tax=Agrococcus sp. BE272 TaxID=2817727 RepID=UPI002854384C|nr:VanZ family protein [Agrococcus sp. BE272]MDR7233177.1 glycopeptide antibiotics resistance protein [Agrococcus sp. BE272]
MSSEPRVVVVPRARRAPLRRLGVVGLLLGIPVVLVVTLWPTHFLLRAKPRVVRGIGWLQARDLADWLSWTRLEVLANVAMFVPLALLLVFVLGARRWWIAVALCVALSLGVEVVQHFMPGRVASVRDIVANGIGALLGALLAVVAEAVVRAVQRRGALAEAQRRASAG